MTVSADALDLLGGDHSWTAERPDSDRHRVGSDLDDEASGPQEEDCADADREQESTERERHRFGDTHHDEQECDGDDDER